jgi:hypothetical protein
MSKSNEQMSQDETDVPISKFRLKYLEYVEPYFSS